MYDKKRKKVFYGTGPLFIIKREQNIVAEGVNAKLYMDEDSLFHPATDFRLEIPTQVISIGFYQFMYRIGMTNNLLALILPAIAAPMTVFFMRQYMLPSLNLDIVASARIDGAGEFRTFNSIVLPIMKPAMATQAIFTYVTTWNSLFLPMVLLTKKENYTMPIMVSLLKGDIYRTEYGAVYLALTLSVLPLFVVYFLLSKYIIAGVALGSVKE